MPAKSKSAVKVSNFRVRSEAKLPAPNTNILRSEFAPRGRMPFSFPCPDPDIGEKLAATYPGVCWDHRTNQVRAMFDVQHRIAQRLHLEPYAIKHMRADIQKYWTGLDQFKALGFHEKLRPYQRKAIKISSSMDAYMHGWDMQVGKTVSSIAEMVLRGARRFLVLCPGIARPTWLHEVPRWLNMNPYIVSGRNASTIYQWRGGRREWWRDLDEVEALLTQPDLFVICSFEGMYRQIVEDAAGKRHVAPGLEGATSLLARFPWCAAIIDESHELKAHRSQSKSGYVPADYVYSAINTGFRVPLTRCLTGTPMVTPVDLYTQLKIMWGKNEVGSRPVIGEKGVFQIRYCDGREVPNRYSPTGTRWDASGSSNQTEFKRRIEAQQKRLYRFQVSSEMPRLTYELREIFLGEDRKKTPRIPKSVKSTAAKWAAKCIKCKTEAILPEIIQRLKGGLKVLVFVRYVDSFDRVFNMISKKAESAKIENLMIEGFKSGRQSAEVRRDRFALVGEHQGPAFVCSTWECLKASASSILDVIDVVEVPDKPLMLQQALARGTQLGGNNMTVNFWQLPGTPDERVYDNLVPKLKAMAEIANDPHAKDMHAKLDRVQAELNELSLDDLIEGFSLPTNTAIDYDASMGGFES